MSAAAPFGLTYSPLLRQPIPLSLASARPPQASDIARTHRLAATICRTGRPLLARGPAVADPSPSRRAHPILGSDGARCQIRLGSGPQVDLPKAFETDAPWPRKAAPVSHAFRRNSVTVFGGKWRHFRVENRGRFWARFSDPQFEFFSFRSSRKRPPLSYPKVAPFC